MQTIALFFKSAIRAFLTQAQAQLKLGKERLLCVTLTYFSPYL